MRSATESIDDAKMGRFIKSLLVLLGRLDNKEPEVINLRALLYL